jgi:large conductance mechanosensitive channel
MSLLDNFKKFALRGNLVDLAVGVIIGVAFNNIVQSVVGDLIMPIVGAVSGGFDFSNHFLPLSAKVTAASLADAKKEGAVLAWGNFLTVTLNFLIVAWVLFWLMRLVNRLMHAEIPKTPPVTKQEELLTQIRDLLKSRS